MNSTAMEMSHPVATRKNGNSGKSSAARCGRFLLLEYFATTYYGPFLQENPVKVNKSIILCSIHLLVTVSLVPNHSLLGQSWTLHRELDVTERDSPAFYQTSHGQRVKRECLGTRMGNIIILG